MVVLKLVQNREKGSTFALYLPYREIPAEVVERTLSTKIDSESVRHKKILVVEDIESNFAQVNILLKKEYTILWVRNGQEAINSFIREKPDLILMDIRMPVMDGIQATEKIRTISLSVPLLLQLQPMRSIRNNNKLFRQDAMLLSPNHILWRKFERNDRNLYWIINFLKKETNILKVRLLLK